MTMIEQAAALADGRATSRGLIEAALTRITDPAGEGARAFIRVHAEAARASADAMDALRRVGRAPSPFAGIPVSVKDLLDIEGEVTTAGSRALDDAAPAAAHAPVVARLLAAGLIPVGRTNMSEFAFSGIGLNPHHGTPRAPWERGATHGGRVPGGSSSGAAVSVADGMAALGIGTDTGGSCRIPAAFCGVVGFKPTARRVPRDGCVPLSSTLDSIGPLGRSVADCAVGDAILAGDPIDVPAPRPVAGLRLLLPTTTVLDDMDATVAAAFEAAVSRLSAAGARITEAPVPVFDAIAAANAGGGFSPAEAHAWHAALLARRGDDYDPWIRARIERGRGMTLPAYAALLAERRRLIAIADATTAPFDAMVMPTVAIIPPTVAEVSEAGVFTARNQLILRNTALGNFLDRCAISVPCGPVMGVMLVGETMGDRALLATAQGIEKEASGSFL